MGYVEEVGRLSVFIASEATFTTEADHIISGGAELGYAQKFHVALSVHPFKPDT
jgi:hypothetical protein